MTDIVFDPFRGEPKYRICSRKTGTKAWYTKYFAWNIDRATSALQSLVDETPLKNLCGDTEFAILNYETVENPDFLIQTCRNCTTSETCCTHISRGTPPDYACFVPRKQKGNEP